MWRLIGWMMQRLIELLPLVSQNFHVLSFETVAILKKNILITTIFKIEQINLWLTNYILINSYFQSNNFLIKYINDNNKLHSWMFLHLATLWLEWNRIPQIVFHFSLALGLLNCLFLFFIHLNLEFSASNEEKKVYVWKINISNIEWFH